MDENVHLSDTRPEDTHQPATQPPTPSTVSVQPSPPPPTTVLNGMESPPVPPMDAAAGAKVLGDMEAGIRDKLVHMSDEFGIEFLKLHSAYIDMPNEIKAHVMYKPMGEKIATVEALLNTLMNTAASFPAPSEDEHVSHGSL
jgi:hypothetical protein